MRIIHNRIRCNLCGEQIESRTTHDRVWCRCGSCGVDGGHSYLRRLGRKENITELSVVEANPRKNEECSAEKNYY